MLNKPLIFIIRSVHDSLCVVKRVLESSSIVCGGGAVEAALSVYLENFATSLVSLSVYLELRHQPGESLSLLENFATSLVSLSVYLENFATSLVSLSVYWRTSPPAW